MRELDQKALKEAALKACPFCGSDRTTIWNAGGGQQAVCKDCRATGPVFTCEEAWRQAFTAWNMRAGEQAAEQRERRLREALTVAEPLVETLHSTATHPEVRASLWAKLMTIRAALSDQEA